MNDTLEGLKAAYQDFGQYLVGAAADQPDAIQVLAYMFAAIWPLLLGVGVHQFTGRAL